MIMLILKNCYDALKPGGVVLVCEKLLDENRTGPLQTTLMDLQALVSTGGQLFIAIYNDQGRASKMWTAIKRIYNRFPAGLRWMIIGPAFARLWGPTLLRDLLQGKPFSSWKEYNGNGRGMSPWCDVVDWVGGYPFEVARPDEIFEYYL